MILTQPRTTFSLIVSLLALASCKGETTSKDPAPSQVAPKAALPTVPVDAKPTAPSVDEFQTLQLVLDENGAVSIDGQRIENSVLLARLQKEHEANPKILATITPQAATPLGLVIGVMDTLKAAHITKVRINTESDPLPNPMDSNTEDHDSLVRDVPQEVLHGRYGPPAETAKFMANSGVGEKYVELLNDYPQSDPQSAKTELLEETWHGDGFYFVIFSHKKNGEWVGLQAMSYTEGTEF